MDFVKFSMIFGWKENSECSLVDKKLPLKEKSFLEKIFNSTMAEE
jgi:hypothetical protein